MSAKRALVAQTDLSMRERVRTAWFGPEPAATDPWSALQHDAALLLQTLSDADATLRAAAEPPMMAEVTDPESFGALARQCVAALPMPPPIDLSATTGGDLRVLFMGRTQAGKSTLLEAFSRGSGERIGDGGQRFSRDVTTRQALTLPGVVVIDPPGVGAADGQEDRDLAFAQVPSADLIVWVASNDSTQHETATALRELGAYGKPVLVVINCRWVLDDEFSRDEFLDDPQMAFEDTNGHVKAISRHLAQAGTQPVAVVALHAQAAFLATRTHGADSVALHAASRIDALNSLLAAERDFRADQRQVLRFVDQVRTPTIRYLAALSATALVLKVYTERAEDVAEDLSQRLARDVDRHDELLATALDKLLEQRRSWHSQTDIGGDLNAAWDAEMDTLLKEMTAAIEANRASLAGSARAAAATVRSDWATIPLQGDLGAFTDFGSVWANRAGLAIVGLGKGVGALWGMGIGLRIGAPLGAKWGAVLGAPEGPLGMLIGAAIGTAIGGVIGLALHPVQRVWERLFVGKAEIHRRRREELRAQIHPHLDAIADDVRVWRETVRAQTQGGFDDHFATVRAALRHEHGTHGAWVAVGQRLDAEVADLDARTARTLLILTGRYRLACAVTRARRQQGTAIAVEYSPTGFAEAALFPPVDTCEPLLAAGPAKPGAAAAQALPLALGLTGAAPTAVHVGDREAHLRFEEPIPIGVTGAWALLLSTFTNRRIQVFAPAPPDPTQPQENIP